MNIRIPFLQRNTRAILYGCSLFFLVTSCSSIASEIEFDSVAWKADLNGCQGKRQALESRLEEIRLDLVNLHERDIRKLFGKPDSEELLERSNKIYIYFVSPGPKCPGRGPVLQTTSLTVRFDALGNVREANLVQE